MSFDVKITGVKPVAALLKRLPKKMAVKHIRRANRQSSAIVGKAIRRAAPRDTGRLARNIKWKGKRGKHTYQKSVVYVQTDKRTQQHDISTGQFMSTGNKTGSKNDAYYWRFIEYGTRYQAANPFITRSAIGQFRRVSQYQFKEIRRGIAAEVRKARAQGRSR